ncbi:MAG: metallophosphoesterase [Deltaproteobacteria bacterium]|nr:metallophosphoesterase [Deltaproteobacteria bacterium]
MDKTKRFFISDIHLSSQALYDDPKKPAWYDPEIHNTRLLGFLEKTVLAQKDQVKDLILLGDVFNTWVCPAKKAPPKYSEIFTANRPVLNMFKKIIKAGIDLYYVNGNHDYDLDPATIKSVIPGIAVINYYRSGRIYAEHGSQYDIYNKPDFVTDPAFGRPIGYFISRLVSSLGAEGYGLIDLADYLDDILEAALTSQNIFSSIIEGLAERANMKETDNITLPHQKKISIEALKERFERLSGVYTLNELINDLYQRRYLNGPADRLCRRYDFNVVVFGHTHNAMLDKDWFLTSDRIYANAGCWCKTNAHSVEVDKIRDPKQKARVRLYKVDPDGDSTVISDEEV